jgi:hypothetical protein
VKPLPVGMASRASCSEGRRYRHGQRFTHCPRIPLWPRQQLEAISAIELVIPRSAPPSSKSRERAAPQTNCTGRAGQFALLTSCQRKSAPERRGAFTHETAPPSRSPHGSCAPSNRSCSSRAVGAQLPSPVGVSVLPAPRRRCGRRNFRWDQCGSHPLWHGPPRRRRPDREGSERPFLCGFHSRPRSEAGPSR